MAKVTVKYVCGCGFSTPNPLEAVIHADSKGHTLDATGRVQPEEKNNRKEK